MKYLPVPYGYRCPLCSNHQDQKFARHPLVQQPLCQGCLIELDHYAKFSSEELGECERRWSEEFARLAGRSWDECRRFILCSEVADWEAIRQNPSGRWWATMMRNVWWSREQCAALVEETLAELREALLRVAEAAAPDAHVLRPHQPTRITPIDTSPGRFFQGNQGKLGAPGDGGSESYNEEAGRRCPLLGVRWPGGQVERGLEWPVSFLARHRSEE